MLNFKADRAKQIKTKAVVNEDPTEKLIRELREQNEKLLEMLKQAQGGEVVKMPTGDDEDDDEDEDDKKELSPEGAQTLNSRLAVYFTVPFPLVCLFNGFRSSFRM